MRLAEFVKKQGGAAAVARRLGVTSHCVRVWLRGEGSPRWEHTVKLVAFSRSALTFEGIVKESTRNAGGKKRAKKGAKNAR